MVAALHPVGRRGVLIALGVFAVALVSRFAGLGHPPGMYFDEVYHARTGAEYLANKEVFEYTHPPLRERGDGIRDPAPVRLPDTGRWTAPARSVSGADGRSPERRVVGDRRGAGPRLLGTVSDGCDIAPQQTIATTNVRPGVVAATTTAVLLGGVSDDGPVLIRFEASTETWRATLPGPRGCDRDR